jgi:hypothetical protein
MDDTQHEPPTQLHFDVSNAPEHLLADDGPDQNITLIAALSQAAAVENKADRFYHQPKTGLRLDSFAALYERKDERGALQLLSRRKDIRLEGSQYVADNYDENIAWQVDSHYLDLQICVGKGLGLAALLPKLSVHHAVEFRMILNKRSRRFSAKYAKLGFDPMHCMMWIGRSDGGQDTWLAWVPNDSMGPTAEDVPPGSGKENTSMTDEHHRMAAMFLASMLRRIGHRDITVTVEYPNVSDDGEFRFATNA